MGVRTAPGQTTSYVVEGNTVRVRETSAVPSKKAAAVKKKHAVSAAVSGRAASPKKAALKKAAVKKNASRITAPKKNELAKKNAFKRQQREFAYESQVMPRVIKESALSISPIMLGILTIVVSLTLFICYRYLCLNASVDIHMDTIRNLESDLEKKRTENDALEQSINTAVDLSEVYSMAINDLGMVHAGQENVINYEKTESEYVRQYENISN